MAKIDLDKIEQIVSSANPSCRNPKLIAERYVKSVKQHIINGICRADSDQLLAGYFPISLKSLQNACGKFKPGNQYYFKILHEQYPLFKIVSVGNNLKRRQTVATTDIPLEILMAGGNKKEIVRAIYKDVTGDEQCDFASIDTQNLTNYINRLKTYDTNKTNARNLRDAVLILTVAEQNEGTLPQIVNESEFGRRYYRGLNLQSCSRDVRHAALGACWSIDISNSVFNWRYSNFHKDGQHLLINTRAYLTDKDRMRKKLAYAAFGNTEKYSIETVKRVMTAISFGARGETNSWYRNNHGQWVQGSISEIIKSPELRKTLFQFNDIEFSMPGFMHEQEIINQYLVKHRFSNEHKDPKIKRLCLTESGKRISEKKFLALMYQQEEREIMEHLHTWSRAQRLLMVHDGAYYKTKPDISSMNTELQQFWPLAKLDLTQVEPWAHVYTAQEQEEINQHLEHIRQEEIKANNGVDPRIAGIHTERLTVKKYDIHAEPNWDEYQQKQMEEYYQHFPKERPFDPNMPDFARKRLQ